MPFNGGIIDATPTRRVLHLSFIDSDGGLRTDSYDIDAADTDAQLNALAAAIGAASNASLYNVSVTNHFAVGLPSKANADDLTNDDVQDNVVILYKHLDGRAFDLFIPANLESATMVVGTQTPDPNTTEMDDIIAAAGAIWTGFAPISYRFSKHTLKGKAVKA